MLDCLLVCDAETVMAIVTLVILYIEISAATAIVFLDKMCKLLTKTNE